MLTTSNLPYSFVLATPKLMDGLSDDDYYEIFIYWSDTSNGEGTQILRKKMYTSTIRTYPEYITLTNDPGTTQIRVLFSYK